MKGRYRGRKPTAMAKAQGVLERLSEGRSKQTIASMLDISVSSVHRVCRKFK
jgi:DNA invertase Pin-like site-specific DNA recombinase